jgi:hypothetical protein
MCEWHLWQFQSVTDRIEVDLERLVAANKVESQRPIFVTQQCVLRGDEYPIAELWTL